MFSSSEFVIQPLLAGGRARVRELRLNQPTRQFHASIRKAARGLKEKGIDLFNNSN